MSNEIPDQLKIHPSDTETRRFYVLKVLREVVETFGSERHEAVLTELASLSPTGLYKPVVALGALRDMRRCGMKVTDDHLIMAAVVMGFPPAGLLPLPDMELTREQEYEEAAMRG